MFDKTGVASAEMVESRLPDQERREKGPYAVFECFQEIPCNPCSTSCKFGAVRPFADINHVPTVEHDKCTGCSMCVSRCPGLAIFIINEVYNDKEATIGSPYELTPLPEPGQEVDALDREGNTVGKATVLKVQSGKTQNKTNVVTVIVPKEQVHVVRNIGMEEDA